MLELVEEWTWEEEVEAEALVEQAEVWVGEEQDVKIGLYQPMMVLSAEDQSSLSLGQGEDP